MAKKSKKDDDRNDENDGKNGDRVAIPDYRIYPDKPIKLAELDADDKGGLDKSKAMEKALETERERIVELQERLYAEGKQSLLIVFQAMDTGGKDGTIRSVFQGTNPQGVQVVSFKAPSSEELAHDFLWRIHAHTPARGMVTVFNRSHYEDVLIVRVKNFVEEKVWRKRYDVINNFEHMLALNGTRILKFYLHISKEEQKTRFQERLDDPAKHWKFSLGDLKEREFWDQYQAAYEDAINHCSTDHAPWYAVPANRNWYRNLIVARTIADTLEDMNPQYPEQPEDLTGVVIPD